MHSTPATRSSRAGFTRTLAASLLLSVPAGLFAGDQSILVSSWEDLHNVRLFLSGSYILERDLGPLDEGYDIYASPAANDGAGWLPIGGGSTFFTGVLDGQGHTITGLHVNKEESQAGLFGAVWGGEIKDLGLADVNITSGGGSVGALSGFLRGTVTNSWSTGSITGGSDQAGGLVGSGRVIMDSCWSGATVRSTSWVGGLIGFQQLESTVTNSYFVGSATALRPTAASHAGGLVADLFGTISTSYAAGGVTASETGVEGGLVADLGPDGTVEDSYWDSVVTGTDTSEGGGTPLTPAQMKGAAAVTHMTALDFDDVWVTMQEGVAINGIVPVNDGYPILRNLPIEPQLMAQAPLIPPAARAMGDFDSNGCVNFQDFLFMLENWNRAIDGIPIGFNDFLALLENWGEGCVPL